VLVVVVTGRNSSWDGGEMPINHRRAGVDCRAIEDRAPPGPRALAGPDEILASLEALTAAGAGVTHGPSRSERLKGIREPVDIAALL
jgi:hypothetical protein